MKYFYTFFLCVIFSVFSLQKAQAKVYVQYDPKQADVSQHVYFTAVAVFDGGKTGPNAPHPPQGISQQIFPDGTNTTGKVLDLSQTPHVLIDDPNGGGSAP